jgi:hypothetical protein
MGGASVLDVDPPPYSQAAVLVAADGDGFVPLELTSRLAAHWGTTDLRVVEGGHATLLWRRRDEMADAITDAFTRFESAA